MKGVRPESVCGKVHSLDRLFSHKLVVYRESEMTTQSIDNQISSFSSSSSSTSSSSPPSSSSSSSSVEQNERRFDAQFCVVYVMLNDICMLVAPELDSMCKITAIIFPSKALHTGDNISGKKKKGAFIAKPGGEIALLRFADGTERVLKSPIGGQLLEVNDRLLSDPGLLLSNRVGTGFIAIIYPSTGLPRL